MNTYVHRHRCAGIDIQHRKGAVWRSRTAEQGDTQTKPLGSETQAQAPFRPKGTFGLRVAAFADSFLMAHPPAHCAVGTARHSEAWRVPLCSVCGSASIVRASLPPRGDPSGSMNRSRSLSAENLHRRIRGPRRVTAGQTADRCPLRFVSASFPNALPHARRLRKWKPRKLNVNVFKPFGFTDGSRKLCAVRSKPFTASLPAPLCYPARPPPF
jgi:hypothetical protein